MINSGAMVEGALRQMDAGNVTLNSDTTVTGHLWVPGTPQVLVNGGVTFGGTTEQGGSASPSHHQLTLNPGATLGGLYTRVDPVALPVVNAVANPNGTQSVNINQASQPSPDWSVIRDCTLNSHVGIRELPSGVYGNFQASDGAGFVLGDENASEPQEYQFQSLQLNGNAQIEVRGKVILRIKNNFSLQTVMGKVAAPGDLQIELPINGMTLNSGARLYAKVLAPSGTVMISSNAQLHGGLVAQQLIVNSGGLLKLLELETDTDEGGGGEDGEPENRPPVVQLGEDLAVALPGGISLAAVSVSDDGLPENSTLTYEWSVLDGPGESVLENADSLTPTIWFASAGAYTMRLRVSDGELEGSDEIVITTVVGNRASPVATVPVYIHEPFGPLPESLRLQAFPFQEQALQPGRHGNRPLLVDVRLGKVSPYQRSC